MVERSNPIRSSSTRLPWVVLALWLMMGPVPKALGQVPTPTFTPTPILSFTFSPTPDGNFTPTATPTLQAQVGRVWVPVSCAAPFGTRRGFACASLDGDILLVGGREFTGTEETLRSDTWRSSDGSQWDQAVPSGAPLPAVEGHRLLVHDGSLWLIGGVDGEGTARNWVFRSQDKGSTWTEVIASGEKFGPRTAFAAVVHAVGAGAPRIWVLGGVDASGGSGNLDDAWSTEDGVLWERAAQGVAALDRSGHEAVSFDGSILLLGGTSQVFSSPDGVSWDLSPVLFPMGVVGRLGAAVFPLFGPIPGVFVVGGAGLGVPKAEVWAATDEGDPWIQLTSAPPFGGRTGHALVVHQPVLGTPLLFLVGGFDGQDYQSDVWFTSQDPSLEATATFAPTCAATGTVTTTPTPVPSVVYNGLEWMRVVDNSAFSARMDHAAAVFDPGDGQGPRMWVSGGIDGQRRALDLDLYTYAATDVWSSRDGVQWDLATGSAPFLNRLDQSAVSFDGRLWLFDGDDGIGQEGNQILSSSFSSEDGANWTEVGGFADFSGHRPVPVVVFDGWMWALGSTEGVARTQDGVTWETVAQTALGSLRSDPHTSLVFDAGQGPEMWIIGQQRSGAAPLNPVYRSQNGVDWTLVTAEAAFPRRSGHASVVFDPGDGRGKRMWVIGGTGGGAFAPALNDVWSSSDGVNWEFEPAFSSAFSPRTGHSALAFDAGDGKGERIWVIGGGRDQVTEQIEGNIPVWRPLAPRNDAWASFPSLALVFNFNPEDCGMPDKRCLALNPPAGGKVGLRTGNLFHQVTDLFIPNRGVPFHLTRSYNSQSDETGIFGIKWRSPLDERLEFKGDGRIYFRRQDGALRVFTPDGSGGYLHPRGYDATLTTADGEWRVRLPDGDLRVFDGEGRVLRREDRNGNRLNFTYDGGSFRPVLLDDGNGRAVSLAYNVRGFLSSMTDPLGRAWTYSYDDRNRLTGVAYPPGDGGQSRAAIYHYDDSHLMIESRDDQYLKGFRIMTYEYDPQGRVVRERDANGDVTLEVAYGENATGRTAEFTEFNSACSSCAQGGAFYQFNQEGIWVSSRDKLGHVTAREFDADLNLASVTDARNHTTSFTYDANGNELTRTDALTRTRSRTYEPVFNRVISLTDEKQRATFFSYDERGNLLTLTDPLTQETSFTYNGRGDRLSATDAKLQTTDFGYDAFGNLTSVTDAQDQPTLMAYDAAGRLASVTDARGNLISYTLDPADRLVRTDLPGSAFITASYDARGNRLSLTDPNLHTTLFTYDAKDRLVLRLDARGASTGFTYDLAGNVLTLTDANLRSTTFQYDALNRLKKKIDPLLRFTEYTYDEVGNLETRRDGKGQVTRYEYDELNRLKLVDYPGSSQVENFYDEVGNLFERREDFGTSFFAYDPLDRMIHKRDAFGNDLIWNYDAVGNLQGMTYPDGTTAAFTHTSRNQTATAEMAGSTLSFFYDPAMNLERLEYPNGKAVAHSYDARNRLETLVGTGGIPSFAYTYDPAGNRLTQTRDGLISSYGYDPTNQLTTAQVAFSGGTRAQSYTYDPAGNRVMFQEGTGVSTYVVDAANQLVHRDVNPDVGFAPVDPPASKVADAPAPSPRHLGPVGPVTRTKARNFSPSPLEGEGHFRRRAGASPGNGVRGASVVVSVGAPFMEPAAFAGEGTQPLRFAQSAWGRHDDGGIYSSFSFNPPAPTPTPAGGTAAPCGADPSRQLDLLVNCAQRTSQERRWFFKLVNNGSSPLTISSAGLGLRFWFYEPHLRCVVVTGANGRVRNAQGGDLGPVQFTDNQYVQSSSIPLYQAPPQAGQPIRWANQVGTISVGFQSGTNVIPPGGWVEGLQVMATSAASCPGQAEEWEGMNDDYTQVWDERTNCSGQSTGPYQDERHFVLLRNGVLQQEVKANGSFDPQSGTPPGAVPCTSTPTRTATKTGTPTRTPTLHTATRTATSTASSTRSATASRTPTATSTSSGTATLTRTSTFTRTFTKTASPTQTHTPTKTWTPTTALSATETPTPESTSTHTWTATSTETHTETLTAAATETPSPMETATFTDTWTLSPTETSTATASDTPSPTPTDSPTSTSTAAPSGTVTPCDEAPTSFVTVPVDGGITNHLPRIEGTAASPCGLTLVELSILRRSDMTWWNGSQWVAEQVWLAAVGTEAWTYEQVPDWTGSGFENYGIYTRATDGQGRVQDPPLETNFDFCVGEPAVSITFPSDGQAYASVTRFEGTADAPCGMNEFKLTLRRASDGFFWDGASWVEMEASFFPNQANFPEWINDDPMPSLEPGGQYTLTASVLDGVGRVVTAVSNFAILVPTATATLTPCVDGRTSYQYDANGNLVREENCNQATLFEYDFENRLSKITHPDGRVETYLYDFSGHLVRKTVEGITTTSIYGRGVAPYSEKVEGSGTFTNFLLVNGKTYAKKTGSSLKFFHHDALGSVTAISDTSGTLTDTYEYDPFGRLLAHDGTAVEDRQFVGGFGVRDIGNNRSIMGVRLYDAELGRFLQEDPIGFAGGDLNLHRYVRNNPLGMIDPEGEHPAILQVIITAVVVYVAVEITISIVDAVTNIFVESAAHENALDMQEVLNNIVENQEVFQSNDPYFQQSFENIEDLRDQYAEEARLSAAQVAENCNEVRPGGRKGPRRR